jgi:flagellar motor protein MotB
MSRKKKAPPAPPSKAYLVSFGDTMTALLAFFIVLNSFAKDQTGANMHSGTGSFVNAVSSIGLPGTAPGRRSHQVLEKKAPAPIYAVSSPDEDRESPSRLGPDEDGDAKRIIDRQTDEFKRFLTEINRQYDVREESPTRSQIVFDSFEKFARQDSGPKPPLQKDAIQIASDSIGQLQKEEFELEIVVWASMPSRIAMANAMKTAVAIQKQIDDSFNLSQSQRMRLTTSAKPWLFVDAKRPKSSFVLSRMDTN